LTRALRRWARSLAWRTARVAPFQDAEFVRYQTLSLEHLLPRLCRAGLALETEILAPFAAALRRAGRRRIA
jgi:hypothetical protein